MPSLHTRPASLWTLLAIGLLTAAPAGAQPAVAPGRRPNVVLIVADDLGWNGVGYHGGFVRTPNIDRIARSGVELDRFYVSPMCSPTREGLMTGRYPMHFGMGRSVVRPWAKFGVPPEERTLAERLGDAGYANRGAFGKWHMGHLAPQWHPLSQGFTEFRGCYNGAANYFTRDRDGEIDWHHNWDDIDEKGYTTNLIADHAAAYVREHAKDGPFFAYVAFTAPHEPFMAPPEYIAKYANLDDDPNDGKPSNKQLFAAMTDCMDDGIGRVLKAVDEAGVSRDTLVIFLSDNGGIGGIPQNNAPLRGAKLSVWEGGVRTPAAVWWPGVIEGGRKLETPVMNIDLLPTILRACGGKAEAVAGRPLDGLDVFDALAGKQPREELTSRDMYFFTGQTGLESEQLAVTSGDGWKLIVAGPDLRRPGGATTPQHRVQLFHLAEDPQEKTDLAAKEPKRVEEMAAKLVAFRKSEPEPSLPPINRRPPKFVTPAKWHIEKK